MNKLLYIIAIIFFSLFGATRAQEQEVWELCPLLNYVFFDLGSSEIPARYKLFANSQDTSAFNEESIGGSQLEKYYNILNIIGSRLSKNTKMKICITACNDGVSKEEKREKLSMDRAKSINNYLKDIWGISEDRIHLTYRDLPEQFSNVKDSIAIRENRRVEITPYKWEHYWDLLHPILDKHVAQEPQIACVDKESATAITARLKEKSKWRYELYPIIQLPYNALALPPSILELLEKRVYNRINNKSVAQVIGRSNFSVSEEQNIKLSIANATTFGRMLKAHCKKQKIAGAIIGYCGVGSGSPIYTDETPEGRFYNRTVQIIIQNPIEE